LAGLLSALALFGPASGVARAEQLPMASFWRDGQGVTGYDLGSRSPERDGRVFSQPVWMLTTAQDAQGTQRPVPGQNSIFDVNVGDPAYTDLWPVVLVKVPQTYQANSARSVADLLAAGYPQTVTTLYLNCPFASQWDSLAGSKQPLAHGWVRAESVPYFDFGPATPDVGTVWKFTYATTDEPSPVPGQLPVIDDSGVSFRRLVWVEVPDDFMPNSITMASQVKGSGFAQLPTEQLVNVTGLPPVQGTPSGAFVLVLLGLLGTVFLAAMIYIVRAV
jgi:hypothetical protein